VPVTRSPLPTALVLGLASFAIACNGPAVETCHRYDAISLTRENQFATRLDWKSTRVVDLPMERVEVSLTAIRPMRGPIELVHLVGDTEADHWTLNIPDPNNSPTSICWIATPGATANCGAVLQNVPFSPGGYYYLRAGDNTVLEAGVAFYLCD